MVRVKDDMLSMACCPFCMPFDALVDPAQGYEEADHHEDGEENPVGLVIAPSDSATKPAVATCKVSS